MCCKELPKPTAGAGSMCIFKVTMGFDLQPDSTGIQQQSYRIVCCASLSLDFVVGGSYGNHAQPGHALVVNKGREGLHSCTCLRGQLS
eukprot:1161038-Pelagomonas_calceolata.AAC.1